MTFIRDIFNRLSYDEKAGLRIIRHSFWSINWLKTLWFNFQILPFKEALKCPVLISYNVRVKSIGQIMFTSPTYPGMISLGVEKITAFETNSLPIVFNNCGRICFAGRFKLHPGGVLVIYTNAELNIGHHVGLGAGTKLVCSKNINIGNDVRISWNCQVFDTDFHFLYNVDKDSYYPRSKEIRIANNVFVGNGTTIGKGTILPDGCVVSCISKVTGDFSAEGENLLIMGNPAIVRKYGVNMSNSWLPEKENEIAKLLGE